LPIRQSKAKQAKKEVEDLSIHVRPLNVIFGSQKYPAMGAVSY